MKEDVAKVSLQEQLAGGSGGTFITWLPKAGIRSVRISCRQISSKAIIF